MNNINGGIEINVKNYYLYKILGNSTMRGVILIMFMTKTCNMSLSEVYLCEACCVILTVLLQIPTGVLADKWGRVKTINVGYLILIGELVGFACATNHIMVWIANAMWAIGYSFVSGAQDALIYDSLKQTIHDEKKLESRYRSIEGKSSFCYLMITAALCFFSGYLSEISIRIPLMIDAILTILTFAVSFSFIEPKIPFDNTEKRSLQHHMFESIKHVLKRKEILWIVSFIVLIGVTSKLWFFTYNPYFEMVGLDLKYYGIVFCGLSIVSAISGLYANQISKKLEGKHGIILSISVITFPMIIMGTLVSKWSISLVLFQNFVRGYMGPFINNMLHKRIDSKNRATVLSVKQAMYLGLEVACMAMFSSLVSTQSLGSAITWLGIISTLLGIILTFYYVKLFTNKKMVTSNNRVENFCMIDK